MPTWVTVTLIVWAPAGLAVGVLIGKGVRKADQRTPRPGTIEVEAVRRRPTVVLTIPRRSGAGAQRWS